MSMMIKFIDGKLISYELLPLVNPYDSVLKTPTELFDFDNPQKDPTYIGFSLIETMEKLGGLGLSANQVGLPYRVCAINMGEHNWVLFNPKVINHRYDRSNLKEGCLSFPGLYLQVNRYASVTVEFYTFAGEKKVHTFEGISAVCVQHEIDHLDGICFTQKVSPIILDREKKKIKKNLKKMRQVAVKQEDSVSY